MKTCPKCGQINPEGRIFCINCLNRLEEEKKNRQIINWIFTIIGGVILIIMDAGLDLSLGHIIPIPYGLSLLGIVVIISGVEGLTRQLSTSSKSSFESRPYEKAHQDENESPNFLVAIVVGVSVGIASSVVWYGIATLIKYHYGVIAIVIGWLIGTGVVIGSGGKRGAILQCISVSITFITLTVDEYMIMRHFLVQALAREGYVNIPLFLPLNIAMSLIGDALKVEPIALLFWIICVGLAFTVPGNFWVKSPSNKNKPKNTIDES